MLFLIILLALSCQQEEDLHEETAPVMFSATTRLAPATKTSYADGLKKADYVISANQNTSSSPNGLQWGSGAHHFSCAA